LTRLADWGGCNSVSGPLATIEADSLCVTDCTGGTGRVPWATASISSRNSCKVRMVGLPGVFGVVVGKAHLICALRGDAATAFAPYASGEGRLGKTGSDV